MKGGNIGGGLNGGPSKYPCGGGKKRPCGWRPRGKGGGDL